MYRILGKGKGEFKDQRTGNTISYCNIFVAYPGPAEVGGGEFIGEKAEKFKCAPDVYPLVEIGENVELYFNQRGVVTHIS